MKKRLKTWKIRIINWIYWAIGTRVTIPGIVEDLEDLRDVWREFSILLETWEVTRFRGDSLSPIRLEACIRAVMKMKGLDWECPSEELQTVIEDWYMEKLDIYEDSLFVGETEIPCIAEGAKGEVSKNFLLLWYLLEKELKQDSF